VGSESVCGEESLSHSILTRAMCGRLPEGLLSEQLPHTHRQLHMRRKETLNNMIVYLCNIYI